MDNNIRQILQKQQNLEYLKKQNTLSQVKAKQTDNRLSTPYVQKILSYIKKLYFFNRIKMAPLPFQLYTGNCPAFTDYLLHYYQQCPEAVLQPELHFSIRSGS